ncbi:hypothetical protein BDW62DRAFT_159848 [Aspergillus aurantiobrunneus]
MFGIAFHARIFHQLSASSTHIKLLGTQTDLIYWTITVDLLFIHFNIILEDVPVSPLDPWACAALSFGTALIWIASMLVLAWAWAHLTRTPEQLDDEERAIGLSTRRSEANTN